MKQLKIKGDKNTYQAARIIKRGDVITGLNEVGAIIFEFDGIKNEENYALAGNAEWDVTDADERDKLISRIQTLEGALVELILQLEQESDGK